MCVFKLEFSVDMYPKVGLQDHMAALFLLLKEPPSHFLFQGKYIILHSRQQCRKEFPFRTLEWTSGPQWPSVTGRCLSALILSGACGTFLSQAFVTGCCIWLLGLHPVMPQRLSRKHIPHLLPSLVQAVASLSGPGWVAQPLWHPVGTAPQVYREDIKPDLQVLFGLVSSYILFLCGLFKWHQYYPWKF